MGMNGTARAIGIHLPRGMTLVTPVLQVLVLATTLIGCGGAGLEPPSRIGSISDRTLVADADPVEIDVSNVFQGEELELSASSSDTNVASVSPTGMTLTVTPENGGTATITVSAQNSSGEATESFTVTVNLPEAPGPPS